MQMRGNIHQLGIAPALIGAGVSLATAAMSKNGGGGGQPGMPLPPTDTATTISPAFQQSFTPQFAPTMQQQQDSPGATQTAIPTQRASTPQTTAITTGEGAMAPLAPPTLAPGFWNDDKFAPVFQDKDKDNYQKLIMTGILAATAIGIATMFKPKRSNKAPTRKSLPSR